MNNKGFGVINVLVFAIFAIFAIFVFYSFITEVIGFIPKGHIPNYTNEYSKYFKSAITNDVTLMSNNKVKYNSYNDIEVAASKATKKYITDFYSALYDNDPLYIKITTLQSYGYMDVLEDINDNNILCTGYTKVVKTSDNVTYDAYINCGDNYTTEDYISRLDN